MDTLNKAHSALIKASIIGLAINFCRKLDRLNYNATIDDSLFTMHYQQCTRDYIFIINTVECL